jgi:small subunit ribosomal protein S17
MTAILTAQRSKRKTLTGVVVSRLGDKSIKVSYDYSARHPLYQKEVKRKTILYVHDEANICKVGDKVKIMETRPLSKLKRWRLLSVLHANSHQGSTGGESHVTA